MASQSLSTLATISVNALSVSLAVFGGGMLLIPQPVSSLFGLSLPLESKLYGRVYGARVLALGGLLWKTRSDFAQSIAKGDGVLMDYARRDLKRVLWISVVLDSIDFGSCLIGLRNGEIDGKVFGWFGGGAAGGIVMATLALSAL